MSLIREIAHVSRSTKDAPLSQLVHPDLPIRANYLKSIANSAIEIARIKRLKDEVWPISIVRIDFMLNLKLTFPAKLLFSDAIRNKIMIQMQESLVVIGLTGLK